MIWFCRLCRIDGASWPRKLDGFMWIRAVQNKSSLVITLNHKHSMMSAKKSRLIKSTSAVDSVMRLWTLRFMVQIKITRTDILFSRVAIDNDLMRSYRTQSPAERPESRIHFPADLHPKIDLQITTPFVLELGDFPDDSLLAWHFSLCRTIN